MEYIKKVLDIAKSLLNIKKEYKNHVKYSTDLIDCDYGFNIFDKTMTLFEWNIQLQAGYRTTESFSSYIPLVDLDITNREDYEAVREQLKIALLSYLNTHKDEIIRHMSNFLCDEAQYRKNQIMSEYDEVNRQIRELKEEIDNG